MKKAIYLPFMILALISCSTTQKNEPKKVELSHIRLNNNFDTNVELPKVITDDLLRQGIKSYTIGVLQGTKLSNNEFSFDAPITVRTSFYSYPTIHKEDGILDNVNKEQRIVFKNKVKFNNKSTINLRINTDKNLSDLLIFDDVEFEGKVYLNIRNSGVDGRFLKIPIIQLPKSTKLNMELFEPVIINGVNYVLEKAYGENSQIIMLSPKFETSDIAFRYREKEKQYKEVKIENVEKDNKRVYLREKITLFIDNDMIGNSHIIDVLTR